MSVETGGWGAMRDAIQGVRGEALHLIAFSGALNLMILAVPVFMIQIFDRVLVSHSLETLTVLAVGTVLALLVMLALDIARGRILARAGMRLENVLALDLFRHNKQGRLGDVATLRSFLTGPGTATLLDLPWVPVFLVVVFALHPLLGWIVLGGTMCLMILAVTVEYSSRRDNVESKSGSAKAMAFAHGVGKHGKDAATALDAKGTQTVWAAHQKRATIPGLRLTDKINTASAIARFIRLGLQVALMSAAAALVIAGDITAGAMIAASVTAARALGPMERSLDVWRAIIESKAALTRLSNLHIVHEKKRFEAPHIGPNALEVQHISHQHERNGSLLFKDVNLDATQGQMIGVTGPSGSGKSALMRILAGINEPSSGRVILNEQDISRLALEQSTKAISYVPQTPLLFPGSVGENIAGFADVSPDEICQAATMAGADAAVRRLPDGYDTLLIDGDTTIPDGLKQQIMLARAFLRRPQLLIMDEPYTFLDNRGVSRLLNTLNEMRTRQTIIVIVSQRPSVLAHCDRILVLDNGTGQIIEKRKQANLRVLSNDQENPSSMPPDRLTTLQGGISV